MNKRMEIVLLADMCCGTGEGNGSNVDTETAFDQYGLPIIPAKRIKGLLRECGQVLCDNGFVSDDTMTELFGNKEGKFGCIKIENAVIPNYKSITADLDRIPPSMNGILSKETIKNTFTSVRTQTSIDENGVAKKLSLRSTEVIKKGYKFYSDISVDTDNPECIKLLEACVKTLRHIGLNKTRGFGEVRCLLQDVDTAENDKSMNYSPSGEKVTIEYSIKLLEDMVICAGSNVVCDYISGRMLQGAFASYTKEYEWFKEVILGNTVFSNAYISKNNKCYLPTPFSVAAIKNKGDKVFNYADGYEKENDKQYVSVGGYYRIDGDTIDKISVGNKYEYHCITGVLGEKRNLFTYRNINKGQVFKGTITGDSGAIDLLKRVIAKHNNKINLGGSMSAQYSKCEFEFGSIVADKKVTVNNDAVIEFISDVIIIDEYGNNTDRISDLEKEIKNIIQFETSVPYAKTTTIGGYNAKWGLPKKQYDAFSKGTVFKLEGVQSCELNETGYIGIMNNEGFGQYRIRSIGENEFNVISDSCEAAEAIDYTQLNEAARKIINSAVLNYLIDKYKVSALENANSAKNTKLSASCAMRLLSAYQSFSSKKNIKSRLKQKIETDFSNRKELYDFSTNAIVNFENIKEAFVDEDLYSVYCDIISENDDVLFDEYIKAFIKQAKRNYQKEEA